MITENLKTNTNTLATTIKRTAKVNSVVLKTVLVICFAFPSVGFSNTFTFDTTVFARRANPQSSTAQAGGTGVETPRSIMVASGVAAILGVIFKPQFGALPDLTLAVIPS